MIIRPIYLILIPLVLSAFTHLWNPAGYPGPDVDEGFYLGRAINFLDTLNPLDPYDGYDHPYFGQIFLAGFLYAIGYPSLLTNPSGLNYEILLIIPRIFMGLLAVIDTLLIYKIVEMRYTKIAALLAATLFAVTPITWLTRLIVLDALELPFVLSSIFFAMLLIRQKSLNNGKNGLFILISGILMGLSIFIKIPAFTMIPLIGYLVYRGNKKGFKFIALWLIPVLLIPMLWPLHAIILGQFSEWVDAIYWQTHRESYPLIVALNDFFGIDSILLIMGIFGLIYAGIKRDFFPLLFAIPLLLFEYFIGYVAVFHLLILITVLCISTAKLFADIFSFLKKKNAILHLSSIGLMSGILIFSVIVTTVQISLNESSQYFKAAQFVNQYLESKSNKNNTDGTTNKPTVVSHPFFFWIDKYKFKNEYNNFWDTEKFETNEVIFIVDRIFKNVINENEYAHGSKFRNLFSAFETKHIASFYNNPIDENGVEVFETDLQNYNNSKVKTENFLDKIHMWTNTSIVKVQRQQSMLNLTTDNTNSSNESNVNFVFPNTIFSLSGPSAYLHISYYIPTYS
ncbi:MAG TPA: hypothetical protein VJS91_07365, partial [Nitrososphaeraceae archaeon]|nr:hypothetical protein [Nitrososphaeraceae archaeon]